MSDLIVPRFEPVTPGLGLHVERHPVLRQYEEAERAGIVLPPRLAGGAFQTWQTLINAYQFSSINAGTAYKESVALTDISPGAAVSGQALTIPAGFLVAGNLLRFTARGWYGTTGKPTIEMGLYWGAVAGKALATRKVEAIENAVEQCWNLEAITRIVSAGETGKAITQGIITGLMSPKETEAAGAAAMVSLPINKPQTEITINTAVANMLTLGAKWGTSNASNSITVMHWLVEILN